MKQSMDRRRFLRRSLLTAGVSGAWMAGARAAAAETRMPNVSPNEKLNVAVIGVAHQGGYNLGNVRSENIVALCDVDDNNLAGAAKQFPQAATYADFRKMLERKDIDAVVISTPDHTHAAA